MKHVCAPQCRPIQQGSELHRATFRAGAVMPASRVAGCQGSVVAIARNRRLQSRSSRQVGEVEWTGSQLGFPMRAFKARQPCHVRMAASQCAASSARTFPLPCPERCRQS